MKKILLRSVIAFFAAGIISAASLPISAAYFRDDDAMQKRCPEVWTNPDTGTVYYSNWSNKEGKYKALYSTDSKPYSELTVVVPQNAATRENILAVCKTYFDDSYQYDGNEHFSAASGLTVRITDPTARAETEQKCDQLFEALNEKYEIAEFTYRMNIHTYIKYDLIDQWLCNYSYYADKKEQGTGDSQTGEKITALIADKYPDWEVRAFVGETGQSYSVRKKDCELFDVPAPEYLDVAYTIKKELGYQTDTAAIPEPYYNAEAVKYYLHPMGDVNLDGDVDVTDAQSVLNIYADTLAGNTSQLVTAQTKTTDVNADGKIDSTDAQLILLYYVQNALAGTPTTWEDLLREK